MKKVEVEGIPFGDGECWCFLVTKATFERVTSREPVRGDSTSLDLIPGGGFRYRLYPGDLIGYESKGALVKLCMEVTKR